MSNTATAYWQRVMCTNMRVPADRSLRELTTDLASMLGSTDPALRDGIAYPLLSTWINRGVYDDLMSGLGDGMSVGLKQRLGDHNTDSVFRRSFSAKVMTDCLTRTIAGNLLPPAKLLDWGDRVATWLLRERDVRGYIPGKGWAHAISHGAEALAALAAAPSLGVNELTVLLDVVADRVLAPGDRFQSAEPDRLAYATLRILHRDLVPVSVLDPWVARIAQQAAHPPPGDVDPFTGTANAEAFLRALYLQLAIAPNHPPGRADLLLVLVDALRASNPHTLTDLAD